MSLSEPNRRPAAIPADRVRDESIQPAPSDPLSLLRLINAVLRGRGLILATTLLVAAGAVALGLLRPRTYSSSASFVPQGRSGGGSLSGIAAQIGLSVSGGEGTQSPQFYVDLINSREILHGLVDARYAFRRDTGAVSGTLADVLGVRAATPALRREEAMDEARKHLSAAVTQKTGVVTLTATTDNPQLSQQLVERVMALINTFNLERRQSQAAAERQFTQQRLAEVRGELRTAEARLADFLQRNREYRNSPDLSFEQSRLAREAALQQQLYGTLAQAYEQAKIDEVRDTPVITLIERPEVPVRPDRRLIIQKAILGMLAGFALGLVIVLVRHFVPAGVEGESDDAAEFALLRREMVGDLTHPWRPVVRAFARRPATR